VVVSQLLIGCATLGGCAGANGKLIEESVRDWGGRRRVIVQSHNWLCFWIFSHTTGWYPVFSLRGDLDTHLTVSWRISLPVS
jgi:hypothetical protein